MDVNLVIGVAALLISVPALLIAIPPFLQMIYGRPSIKVRFSDTVEQNTKFLLCNIYNVPIGSGFLRAIGVTRSATEVFSSFDIREHGTKKIIANFFRASLIDTRSHAEGLVLPLPPPLPVIIQIVAHGDKGALTESHAPGERQQRLLPPGEYFADLKIAYGEKAVVAVAHSFTVAPDKFATHWTARKIKED